MGAGACAQGGENAVMEEPCAGRGTRRKTCFRGQTGTFPQPAGRPTCASHCVTERGSRGHFSPCDHGAASQLNSTERPPDTLRAPWRCCLPAGFLCLREPTSDRQPPGSQDGSALSRGRGAQDFAACSDFVLGTCPHVRLRSTRNVPRRLLEASRSSCLGSGLFEPATVGSCPHA